jgi:hypothetical protein
MREDTIITDEQNFRSSQASGSEMFDTNNSGINTTIIMVNFFFFFISIY